MPLKDNYDYSQEELDQRSRQMDPEHDDYWQSRGYDERPDDWQEKLTENNDQNSTQ